MRRVRALLQRESNKYTYPDTGYSDWLGLLGRYVENSTKLTCLEITGYLIKYSRVSWLLERQIRRGRKD